MLNRVSTFAAVGVVATLLVTGCSSTATDEPATSASPTTTTEASASPTPSPTEELGAPTASDNFEEVMEGPVTLPVGSAIEIDGWSITVGSVLRNQQEAIDQFGGELPADAEGHEVITLSYTATRIADTPGSIEEPQVDVTDSNWEGSVNIIQDIPYQDFEGGTVAPGTSFTGRIFQTLDPAIVEGGDLQANVWIASEGSSGVSMSVETTI